MLPWLKSGTWYFTGATGFQESYPGNGDHITFADPAMILEKLIGRVIADKIME